MITRKHFKKLTEKEFNQLKNLQKEGLTHSQLMQFSKRASGTISNIMRSETLNDYYKIIRAWPSRLSHNKITVVTNSVNEITPNEIMSKEINNIQLFANLETTIEQLKTDIEAVIEEGIKQGVEKEMQKIFVELRELRLLKAQAKTNNWAFNLARKFNIT